MASRSSVCGKRFEAERESFGASDGEFRVRPGPARRPPGVCRSAGRPEAAKRTGIGAIPTACRGPASASRLLPSTRRAAAAQIFFFAFTARDLIGASGDGEVDHRRHQTAASRISWSSSATASRTLARSSSSRAAAGGRSVERALDPLKRSIGAVERCGKAAIVHAIATNFGVRKVGESPGA